MTSPCRDTESGSLTKTEGNLESLFHFQSDPWAQAKLGWSMTSLSDHHFSPLLPQVLIPRTVLNIPCTKLHLRVSFLRNLIIHSDKVFHLVNAYINVSFYNSASHTKANIIDVPMHAFHPIQTFHQYRSFSQIRKLSSILVLVTTVSNEQENEENMRLLLF